MSASSLSFWAIVACVHHVTTAADLRVVDLTHAHSPDTIYWPGSPEYKFDIIYRGENTEKGFWYESNAFYTAEHGGTHLDAPAHFSQGSKREHEIPMANLVGPGVVINVKEKAASNPDYQVTIDDLKQWEDKYGVIPSGAMVMMNSGWSHKYPVKALTFGSNTPNDSSTFHFPSFHAEAADWLVTNRDIHVIGVDTPSTDYGQSVLFPVHVILGKANIPGVENVADLDNIPEAGTTIFVAAIKLYDGSGGPARVFATYTVDGGNGMTGSTTAVLPSKCLVAFVGLYMYFASRV